MHHLSGAPDIVSAGAVELGADGAVHLGVIAHKNAGLVGKIFRADHLNFRIEEPNTALQKFVQQRCFLFCHGVSFFRFCA